MSHVRSPRNDPRVSVIIPAFNASETLATAVRSVLSQTERNLEVVIVDDCSQDNTAAVAEALADEDARVSVLRMQRNGGKSTAMNRGTEHARGKWIAVVDADDWCAPTRLQRLIDKAETAGVEMAADNQVLIDAESQAERGLAFAATGGPRVVGLDGFLDGSNPLESFDIGMLKPVFRADFIRKHQVEYHVAAKNGHDFYVLLSFFIAGGHALLLPDALYYYRQAKRQLWNHAGRNEGSRYRFDLMKQTNDHFLSSLEGRLTARQRRKLVERGRQLEVMRRLHQLKGRLLAKDMRGTARVALSSPFLMWVTLARRATARMVRAG